MAPEPNQDGASLSTLRERLRGPLILPGDAAYDGARAVWNGRIDRRPDAVARCSDAADVQAVVDFAREHDVRISVKSTGHSYAGASVRDGGIVIDLSSMNAVQVDAAGMRARVGPGTRWGAFDRQAQAFGLATTGATVSTVGVSGYTLGGGTGYLARKHGLGLDNLLAADIVTADGDLVRVSEDEHADLFWGLRGGGAHLGVVTALEFQLHRVGPQIMAGQIVYDFESAREVLRFWREYMADAPNELQCYAFLLNIPPIDAFPKEHHGHVGLDLVAAYAGPLEDGKRVLDPLRNAGKPMLDTVSPQAYVDVQAAFDAGTPPGLRWHSRAHFSDEISDELIDAVLHHCRPLPGPFTLAYFEPLGGAISAVDPAATAYAHRDAAFSLHIFPGWTDPDADGGMARWAQAFSDDVARFARGGVYVNLLSDDEGGRVPEAYGENYERLVMLKRRYDPRNLISSELDTLLRR